jgi:hypothetical protein
MLDLTRTVMRLAQGQRPAEMTLARQADSERASADGASEAQAAEGDQTPEVDPNLVAERVYQLMRQDLRTSLERRA